MIKSKIQADLNEAMKARDKDKVSALRLIAAAIKQIEVDERIDVDDTRMLVLLDKLAKQRQESISQFSEANRHDLVEKEQYELQLIKQYLPEPLSEDKIIALVDATISELQASKMSDMGRVMAILKPKLQGRADIAKVSALVKNKLN